MPIARPTFPRPQRFVEYHRVSKPEQGQSGLGLESQRALVRNYIDERSGRLLAEFSEVASGRWAGRPQLREAIKTCRAYRATLILATMDRLARNVRMIADLAESGLDFVAVDFPEANRFMVHVLAALAEYESNLISARVKEGLAVARAKGVKMGRPRRCPPAPNWRDSLNAARASRIRNINARADDVAPILWDKIAEGLSRREIASELNRLEVLSTTRRPWKSNAVDLLLRKFASIYRERPEIAEALRIGPAKTKARTREIGLAPALWRLRFQGPTNREIGKELTALGHRPPEGGEWHSAHISQLFAKYRPWFLEQCKTADEQFGQLDKDAQLVRRVWWLAASGLTNVRIAAELNGAGREGRGGKQWTELSAGLLLAKASMDEAIAGGAVQGTTLRAGKFRRCRLARTLGPRIALMRGQQPSYQQIAEAFNAEGVVTRCEGLAWSGSMASKLARFYAYLADSATGGMNRRRRK